MPAVNLSRTLQLKQTKGPTLRFQIPRRIEVALHDYRCRGVLNTPALRIVPSGLKILSMVRHADLIMYLVAIKSFYKRIGHGEIVIVDDGTLTPADRAALSHHTGSQQILQGKDVDTGTCPTYTSWRRLFSVLNLTRESYVIQLDSDTVTRGDIPEVLDCVRSNTSFTLGTKPGRSFITLAEASKIAQNSTGTHVQDEAERNFGRLPGAEAKLYVRGSAGFTGFSKNTQARDQVVAFSDRMKEFIGKKWMEWGSEQVTSNYLISNAPGAIVLPHPKYSNFHLQLDPKDAAFLHFIGTNRYDRGVYTRESRAAIRP